MVTRNNTPCLEMSMPTGTTMGTIHLHRCDAKGQPQSQHTHEPATHAHPMLLTLHHQHVH